MPRRPSAAAGLASNANPSSSSIQNRSHKSSDSHSHHHIFGQSQSASSLNHGAPTTPQQKIVQVLVNRLKNKLPCNSGVPLDRLEEDNAIQQAVDALVNLAHESLDMIGFALGELLEKLTKNQDINEMPSLEVLQSQLFLLKVLSVAMASRWSRSNPRPSSRMSTRAPDDAKRNQGSSSIRSPTPSTWSDPAPLEEACAKYVLSVMILFLRQTALPEPSLMMSTRFNDIEFRDYENAEAATAILSNVRSVGTTISSNRLPDLQRHELRPRPSSSSFNSDGQMSSNSYALISDRNAIYEKTHMSSVKTSHMLNQHILRYAGRIIMYISASNWKVVFQRLRTKIHFLAAHTDESADTTDLLVLGHSVLDRQRVLQVFNELSSLLVNMGLESHKAISSPLRAAIWSWIEDFPAEFSEAVRSRGKMDGAPGVFDLIYNKAVGAEHIFWPTLMTVMCITAERTPADLQSLYSGRLSHKSARFFEEMLRHPDFNTRIGEVALACGADLCRAAMNIKPGEDEIPLQMIAFDVAHEMRINIWNPARKSFWEYYEEINIALFAEALVCSYRFLPPEEGLGFFAACLEPERSDAVKTCAVRGCLTLAQEASRFSWQKPLDPLDKLIAPRLREIFKAASTRRAEVDHYGNAKKSASRPKAKKINPQPLSDREVLLLAILSLWRHRPTFFLTDMSERDAIVWANHVSKLWESPLDSSVKVSVATTTLIEAELSFMLTPDDPFFEPCCQWMMHLSQTLASVVTSLLYARTELESQRLWTGLTLQLLELYLKKTDAPRIREIQRSPARVPIFTLTEIALLVSLPSSDSGVSHLAAQGLRLLSQAENQPDAPPNPTVTEDDKSKRSTVYERLGDPKILVVGRVVHQKRIRKLIRLMPHCASVNIAAWQECYSRFSSLTEAIMRSIDDAADDVTIRHGHRSEFHQEKVSQWQNLALFLASTAGACLQEDHDPNHLASVVPQKFLPDFMRVMQRPGILVSEFVNDLTALLICEDVQVRDVAREALGAELSPRLYPKILKYFDEVVQAVQLEKQNRDGRDKSTSENMLLFVDQFIAVLKLIAENTQVRVEEVANIDISPTLLGLASFITRFDTPESSRIKSKFCALCDSVCERTECLTLRRDSPARRDILDTIILWIVPPEGPSESNHMQYELNMACLRTCVKLLDRLQLRPPEPSSAGDDSVHFVSRLFIKYSTVLLNGLEICQLDIPTSDSVSDVGSIQSRMRASQRETELRELVITGLSHLVSANTESGFKHCLPLAYNEDNRKRTIFAHVFARVMSQGTKFDPEERSSPVNGQHRLATLMKESDMTLVVAVCETCPPGDVESMISVLLNLFDTRASLMKLVKVMIDREVAHTENEASLFRSNSTCTRFLSAFAKIHGYNYLRGLVMPLIKCMESLPPGQGYELDPAKAGEQDVIQNRKNIEFVAKSFLDIITASTEALPSMFREICVHIAKTVSQRWPDAKFAALGAFVFLRFISPAVVAPETIDLEIPGDGLRRGLTLIAKIIQNLANNIFFGKEAHMMVLNDFLREHIAHVTRFLSELNRYNPGEDDDDEWLGTTSDDTDILVLHRFFDKHADKIGKELLSTPKASAEGDTSAVNGKRAWDDLCTLLVDLGPPMEVPKISSLDKKDHREFKELMARCADRSTEAVQDILLVAAPPNRTNNTAYFVFRFSKLNVEAIDMELMLYYFFATLTSPEYQDCFHEIILDCTDFSSMSEIPLFWLKWHSELIPSDVRMRIVKTHILNPNVLMQKFLRRMYNVCPGAAFCGEARAWSSIAEFWNGAKIPQAVIESDALKYPLSLEQEQSDMYPDVTMKMGQTRTPVFLSIGATHIRITTARTSQISTGLVCRATEIVLLADVSDVYNVQTGHESNEFIIRRSRQGDTIYFTSPGRETIVKAIRAAKGRLKESHSLLAERFLRFSNVPATLLHVGLLSVDPLDEELRAAAYDLLGAVSAYLNYDKSPIIAPKSGFVPGDSVSFVISFSTRIAQFAPQLTLDFISEVAAGLISSEKNPALQTLQRITCIRYMSPWIKNLEAFANPTSPLYERSGARLRDCIRVLIDLTISIPELATNVFTKYIWNEVGKLESSVVEIIFDEMIRAATDGGIGTHRCEIMTHTITAISSIHVRGRLFAKLRKAIIKASPRLMRVPANSSGWTEVSTLIRITLVAGSDARQPVHDQLYVPEIAHIVTLIAGVGSTLVRKSVYGIVVNLLQSLYFARVEEGPAPEMLQLITDCTTQEEILQLFGLIRPTNTSEYSSYDPPNDKAVLGMQERLTALLVRILDVSAGTKGQLNVWKARWMSLATASAFQYSSMIQMRSFTALGALATSDVDDDFMYQMLMAFRTALAQPEVSDITALVSMLRCVTKVIPGLPADSRHVPQLFWLGVAFLQSSHIAFFEDAAGLVVLTMRVMEKRGMFANSTVPLRLLEARSSIEEPAQQFDSTLQLSYDSNFSFCLAAVIFKGIRHSGLRESAEEALRTLLGVTVRVSKSQHDLANGYSDDVLDPDALGYFLALLSFSTTNSEYRRLLKECDVDESMLPDEDSTVVDESSGVPPISIDLLGINDHNTALLTTSFISVMLSTAQGDDAESEILYSILADIAMSYPETIQMAYESLQDRIKDIFANSSNPSIIHYVSTIIRVALDDNFRNPLSPRIGLLRGSSSTLNTTDEASSVHGPGRPHLKALEEQGMQGLAKNFQFLPANNAAAGKVLILISNLVALIVS